jgi:hypothetical protein
MIIRIPVQIPASCSLLVYCLASTSTLITEIILSFEMLAQFLPKYTTLYEVSQEERSIFREVIRSVTLSKKMYMYMRPSPNGFRDIAVSR